VLVWLSLLYSWVAAVLAAVTAELGYWVNRAYRTPAVNVSAADDDNTSGPGFLEHVPPSRCSALANPCAF